MKQEWSSMILIYSCPITHTHTLSLSHTHTHMHTLTGAHSIHRTWVWLYSPALVSPATNLSYSLLSLKAWVCLEGKRIAEKIKLDIITSAKHLTQNSNTVLYSPFLSAISEITQCFWKNSIDWKRQHKPLSKGILRQESWKTWQTLAVRLGSLDSYITSYIRGILFPWCALWDYGVQAKGTRKLCKCNPGKPANKTGTHSRSKPAVCSSGSLRSQKLPNVLKHRLVDGAHVVVGRGENCLNIV